MRFLRLKYSCSVGDVLGIKQNILRVVALMMDGLRRAFCAQLQVEPQKQDRI